MLSQDLQTIRQQERSNSNPRRADVNTTDQPTKEGAKDGRDAYEVKPTIELGYRSDHSLITLSLKLSGVTRSKTFWKFNNTLANGEQFVHDLKVTITE
ncbi:Cd209 antigen [Plakobranchus ocellatus]|uniref:Cd209 antigen n=1 Tax=Plakobranchus ocellatus TaxID=259542 RepID=A0AAV4DJS5_9GAST|nr:Cd209 antigen [Plakobranchus ocellatus]